MEKFEERFDVPIGGTVTVRHRQRNVVLTCVERERGCIGCYFEHRKLDACMPYYCNSVFRRDDKNVKFVRV